MKNKKFDISNYLLNLNARIDRSQLTLSFIICTKYMLYSIALLQRNIIFNKILSTYTYFNDKPPPEERDTLKFLFFIKTSSYNNTKPISGKELKRKTFEKKIIATHRAKMFVH